MGLFRGGSEPVAVYRGSTPIKEVYAGSTLVWKSGPSWPQTGSWYGNTTSTATTFATFTVAEAGVYDFEWAVTWGGSSAVAGRASYRINTGSGVQGNLVNIAPGTSTVTGSSVTLAVGDVVEFRVISIGTVAATGAWTVTKN